VSIKLNILETAKNVCDAEKNIRVSSMIVLAKPEIIRRLIYRPGNPNPYPPLVQFQDLTIERSA
jgi:hypothetical protein